MRIRNFKNPVIIFLLCAFLLVLTSCGPNASPQGNGQPSQDAFPLDVLTETDAGSDVASGKDTDTKTDADQIEIYNVGSDVTISVEDGIDLPSDVEIDLTEDAYIDPDGIYTSRDDVALYIHTYDRLPSNFITKARARELGWNGGGLEDYAPGMCIGGDRFGNYEELLPDGDYLECDIDTLGASGRGAKRLVWDTEGDIYYTDDHYDSFVKLY